jgi:parallel beta-helix repeat protein
MKRWLPIYLLLLIVVPALAQVSIPETAEDFKNTYGVNSSLDNIIHYALNPALRALSGGGTAGGLACDDVTDDGPKLQTAMNTSGGSRIYLPANASCRIKTYVSIPSHVYLVGQNTNLNFDPAATHSGSQNVTMMADGTSVNPITDVTLDGVIFNGPGTASINDRVKFVTNYAQRWKVMFSTFKNFGNTTNSTTRSTTYGHGIQFFNASDIDIHDNFVTNNVGDGISFSNNINRVRIRDNTVTLNWDSQIVPCTIGGNDIVTSGNTMIAPTGTTTPPLVIDECTNTETVNNNITAPTSNWCILMERVQSNALINQDNKVIGNTCNGSMITISSAGTTQGTNTVARGGMTKVIGNTVINSNNKGIYLSGSTSVTVTGNHIANAATEGIAEESFGDPVGNNVISNNIVDGAQRCLRQVNSGGTVLPSIWTNNILKGCSVKTIDLLTVNVGGNSTNSIGFSADGTTDNCATLNAALQIGPVHLPRPASVSGFYRSSCKIIVPHGSALYGEGIVSDYPSGVVGGVEIRCDNSVMICVQLGDDVNIGNKTGEIVRIKAGRTGTPAPAGSAGFKLVGGFVPRLDNVVSDNHDICYLLKTPPGTGSGLSAQLTKIHTGRCQDVHVWNDSYPEVRIESSRFGMSSVGTGAGNAYLRMSCSQRNCTAAGTPSGWFINNSQFNSGDIANPVGTLFDFSNASDNSAQFFAGDWGEVKMSDVHVELVTHAVQSDGTFYQIKDFGLANNTIATLGSFFNLHTNTNIWRWHLTGNTLASGADTSLTMAAPASGANIQDFTWTGGSWNGNLTITGVGAATMYIANVSFGNNLTVNGSFGAFNETGDNISGSYTEAITGPGSPPNVTVVNNRKLRHTGVTGVTCASVNAATLTSWNGLVTHC